MSTWNSVMTIDKKNIDVGNKIAVELLRRLSNEESLKKAVDSNLKQEYPSWSEFSGYLDLALAFTYAYKIKQEEDLKIFAKKCISRAQRSLELSNAGLHSGITQLGFAANYLGSDSNYYSSLLSDIDLCLEANIRSKVKALWKAINLADSDYDVISGDVPQIVVPRQADNSSTFTEFAYSVGVS